MQKGLALRDIEGKQPSLRDDAHRRARPSTRADAIPEGLPAAEKIRLALRAISRRGRPPRGGDGLRPEWQSLDDERREEISAERRRYEERIRALFREGREGSEPRTDLDEKAAALLFLSAANWAYTWLRPGQDTDAVADAFYALLIDGMRGYSTPA